MQHLDCRKNKLTELKVRGCTALPNLYCDDNKLTELDVRHLNSLQKLECRRNQLTSLNVQGCGALKELDCNHNQLSAQAFIKLFNDLPVRSNNDGADCVLYSEKAGEGNHTDFTAPADLAEAFINAKTVKKWYMFKRDKEGSPKKI